MEANPKNEACATIVGAVPVEEAHAVADKLDKSVREGRMKPIVDNALAIADRELARQAASKELASGKPAPEIELNDLNGKPLKLSSLKGKFVIIDFWGSWCGWCIKGFPALKQFYYKHKDRLAVLGVDCNDTEDAWRKAVKEHELTWLHVYCPRESDVLQRYAVSGFPTKVLVDPEGKIVNITVGEDPHFFDIVEEAMKK